MIGLTLYAPPLAIVRAHLARGYTSLHLERTLKPLPAARV